MDTPFGEAVISPIDLRTTDAFGCADIEVRFTSPSELAKTNDITSIWYVWRMDWWEGNFPSTDNAILHSLHKSDGSYLKRTPKEVSKAERVVRKHVDAWTKDITNQIAMKELEVARVKDELAMLRSKQAEA